MKYRTVAAALYLMAVCCIGAPVTVSAPPSPSLPEKTAATDLKHYLDKALPEGFTEPLTFHVGTTAFAKQYGLGPDTLKDDQYVLRRLGNDVILIGGGTRGTLYAVYRFLEDYLGIHWWTPEAESVPVHTEPFELTEFDRTETPVFLSRIIYPDNRSPKTDNGRFAIRNRLNNYGDHPITAEYGGAIRFGRPYMVHTFDWYMPVREYMAKHPEYFSLNSGKRVGGQYAGQLCLSNPAVAEIFIAKIKDYIVQDEEDARRLGIDPPRLYDISQNDNPVMCQCPACQAIVREEGANSGLIIRFVNQIAAAVKEFRPNCKVSTLAYMMTELPPQKTKPLENVVIRLCNTADNKTSSVLAPEQEPYRRKIRDWSVISNEIYIWEYSVIYGPMQPPYPSEYFVGDLFNFYAAGSVRHLFMEHELPEKADMHALKTWLEARMLENPAADRERLAAIFMDGYYGAAAPYLTQYRELLRDSVRRHHSFLYAFVESTTYLDLDTVLKSMSLFDQAEQKVADNPELLRRVRRERFNLEQAAVLRYRKLTSEWAANGNAPEKFPLNYRELLQRVESQWRENILALTIPKFHPELLNEMKQFIDCYAALPETVGRPKKFKHWKPGTIDMTVDLAKTFQHKIVSDPDSEAGFAVFVDLAKTAKKGAVPLETGAYSVSRALNLGKGLINPNSIPGPGYNYYHCMTVKPELSAYVYLLWDWRLQFTLDSAAARGEQQEYDVYISAKFSGQPYKFSSPDAPYGIFVDRCLLVPRS